MSEDIVERLRAPTDDDGDLLQDAADALTALSARLAECEAREADFHHAYRAKCDEETKALHARTEALEKALKPFAEKELPSNRKTETSFDWNGLRRSMSPLEIAMINARRALMPLLPIPTSLCKNCDGNPNCYCARAALEQKS